MAVIVVICVIYVRARHRDGGAVDDPADGADASSRWSSSLGFDPIWFGILIVVVVEIGLISPPVGMNLFVLRTLLPEVPTGTLYARGAAVRRRRRGPAGGADRFSGAVDLAADRAVPLTARSGMAPDAPDACSRCPATREPQRRGAC